MKKTVLFEGKTTMAGMDVALKIYRVDDEEQSYYEWDYNPHLVDENQKEVHNGEIKRGNTLEELLSHINSYKNEIRKIKEIRPNKSF